MLMKSTSSAPAECCGCLPHLFILRSLPRRAWRCFSPMLDCGVSPVTLGRTDRTLERVIVLIMSGSGAFVRSQLRPYVSETVGRCSLARTCSVPVCHSLECGRDCAHVTPHLLMARLACAMASFLMGGVCRHGCRRKHVLLVCAAR
jgi:hypothetical protein